MIPRARLKSALSTASCRPGSPQSAHDSGGPGTSTASPCVMAMRAVIAARLGLEDVHLIVAGDDLDIEVTVLTVLLPRPSWR